MFSPTDHEFHEWTLADFLQENCELPLDGRLAAIADHRCSPTLAKRAVLDFCHLEIGFFLQNDPLAAEAMRRVATLDNGRTPSSPGTEGVRGPGIASVCWKLERAWRLIETDEDDCAELHRALRQTTEQLYAPIEQIGESARRSAAGQFPFSWIPRYSTNACAFKHFDSARLNTSSLRYSGPRAAVDALFRFATLDADDFYTVCAALIMENGGKAAAMQDAYAAAYNRRCGDAFLFIYECLPELVDTASYDRGARNPARRAQTIRSLFVRPLAALFECGALGIEEAPRRAPSVLEQRLRDKPRTTSS